MSIFGINEAYGVSGVFEAVSAARGNRRDEEKNGENPLAPKDTVSISSEGLALAAQRAPVQSGGAAGEESGGQSGREKGERENDETEGQAGSGGVGGGLGAADGSDPIEKIEKKIEQLQAKMAEVASSGLPDEVKQSQLSGLQGSISALQQTLNALKQAALDEAGKSA